MDEEYDVVVLGTGLTECILSGLLSVEGKKVLHMDRNDYYGGECASLNLSQIFGKFRKDAKAPESLGKDRDYNIDLIPKFAMANGEFVKILVYTDVTRYLEFKQVSGSYVYRDGRIAKVPGSEIEAVSSPLMGIFEKRRAKRFFEFIQKYELDNPATQEGIDVKTVPMSEIYKKFGLEPGTQDFIGHAMALHLDDSYLTEPALQTYENIRLYMGSLARYGKSPYIYPMYGLGDLPQSFARLSAIYGGTYMLNKTVDEIVYGPDGKVVGVRSGDETVKCKAVIADPSYVPSKVKKIGQVIRSICILNHPIPNTGDVDSLQLIIPQNQLNRKHDIYIAAVSFEHRVSAKGYWIAMVSTIVETGVPENEIHPAVQLLGPVLEKFNSVVDIYEPVSDGKDDNVFISKSYDSTSHFETVTDDVKDIYARYWGKPIDFQGKIKRGDEEAE
ncbi:rab GTPase activator [Gonapodya prolifera JEL478]|uniref:Rab GDP dissociation inhibitor n=1 Tax=Gonapodya prolifera (strain JEL478) TaxID=1344416 RepID=A0A139AZ52_GONPJ|nr:rab GTPase activator [Gonapodya prolifera JEL478]|eukprot:KXS22032.1 rab GTPase activator [Gonapodya prolifera JEL478]